MKTIDPSKISEEEVLRFVLEAITPRPVTLVSTLNDNGTTNVAPYSFVNVVSGEPPLLSLAIQTRNGELKDTARNLLRTGEAVVQMVHFGMLDSSYATVEEMPYGKSELEKSDLTLVDAEQINVKSVEQSFIRFEVELFTRIHVNAGNDLFLLKIVRMHFADKILENNRINFKQTKSVGALVENQFIDYDNHILIKDETYNKPEDK